MSDLKEPLRPVTGTWIQKIKLAWEFKRKKFQDDADEAMQFFNGPYDFLYGLKNAGASRGFVYTGESADLPRPSFCMTINKVAEMVQLFGPALYHRNPNRKVNFRQMPSLPPELFGDPNDPRTQMQAQQRQMQNLQMRSIDQGRAILLETYLNYTPMALDLKTESRWAVDEAIITGLGALWTEVYQPAGAQFKMVGSFFDSSSNLVMDPDAENFRDVKWIARKCIHPFWEVEEEYGLESDSLRGKSQYESFSAQSNVSSSRDGDYNRKRGLTNDLLVYWKIWSKMGIGGRLMGIRPDLRPSLDQYGKYTYLVVADSCNYPLNLPPALTDVAFGEDLEAAEQAKIEMQKRLEWPTPFWADDAWPFSPLIFHSIPKEIYPMSHVKPGMGELKFLNWAFSFLAGKVRTASRDFIGIAKSAGEELKDIIKHGSDYTTIEVEALHGSIDNVVKFLQHPPFNQEIYKIIEGVAGNFEKRTGLTELMYGLTHNQMRSAYEAEVKGDQVSVRPDDMASKVEDWMTEAARKEAFAARWHLHGQDVVPVMGPEGGQWWDQLVTAADPAEIIHQLEYRVEAGSAKKPNKGREAATMQQAVQLLFQPLFGYSMSTGDVGPVNRLITEWAKSLDLEPEGFLIKPPPPQPNPEEIQAQQAQQEMAMAGQRHQLDTGMAQAKHAQEQQHKAQAHLLQMKMAKEKASNNGTEAK